MAGTIPRNSAALVAFCCREVEDELHALLVCDADTALLDL
jgi:hypothetical protein